MPGGPILPSRPSVWCYKVPSQYPKRRLSVRSRKVSKPRDLYLELSDRSEIWQALRQQCCRCACQISKRYDNLKYQSRGFETLRDLKKRRLFGYWDGALDSWLVSEDTVSSVADIPNTMTSCPLTSAPTMYYSQFRHRAGLRECPSARRYRVMVRIERRRPVRRISLALNLGLDSNL